MALIIRPNSGINNAMAGIAAGLGQGMQLGFEKRRVDLQEEELAMRRQMEQNRQNTEDEKLKLLKKADERAANQAELASEQLKADRQVGGMMAQIDQLGAAVSQAKQRSLDDYAKIGQLWGRLQENPSLGIDPATGEARGGAKWVRAQALLGPQLKDEDLALLDQYQQKLKAAAEVSAYMSPQQQAQFRGWADKLALRDLDSNARQSFAKTIADDMRRGAYRIMLENGEEVDDETISARVSQLTEMAADPSIPTAQLRQMNDSILKEIQATNDRQAVFVTRKAELTNMWNQAYATGNSDVSQAARATYQAMKQGLRGPALDEMMTYARQGNVKVYDMDNKPHIFPASTANENLKSVNDLIQRTRQLEADVEESKAKYYGDLGQAAKTRAEGNVETTEEAARAQAKEDWKIMTEQDRQDLLDERRKTTPGYSAADYINERAGQYMNAPKGGSSGAPAGGGNAQQANQQTLKGIIGDLTQQDKEAIARAQAQAGFQPRGGSNLTAITPEERKKLDTVALFEIMKLRGYTYNQSSGMFFNPETKQQVKFVRESPAQAK
jgi:hypothetical protein